jgi:hypothetical protein
MKPPEGRCSGRRESRQPAGQRSQRSANGTRIRSGNCVRSAGSRQASKPPEFGERFSPRGAVRVAPPSNQRTISPGGISVLVSSLHRTMP